MKVAESGYFRFLGNIHAEKDINLSILCRNYSAVVLASGTSRDKALCIPGENCLNVFSAREFVNWYNGYPENHRLSDNLNSIHDVNSVAIIGQGNVALDCARILARRNDEQLSSTDISTHALKALRQMHNLRDIFVIGRRGPVQAAFTIKELRELTKLSGAVTSIEQRDLAEGDTLASQEELLHIPGKRRIRELMMKIASSDSSSSTQDSGNDPTKIHLQFLRSPVRILSDGVGRVSGVEVERTRLEGVAGRQRAVGTGVKDTIPCQLLLRSVGYEAAPFAGLQIDPITRGLRHLKGRVLSHDGAPIPGLYVTGWLKRGPVGILGTNIPDARETAEAVLEDLRSGLLGRNLDPEKDPIEDPAMKTVLEKAGKGKPTVLSAHYILHRTALCLSGSYLAGVSEDRCV